MKLEAVAQIQTHNPRPDPDPRYPPDLGRFWKTVHLQGGFLSKTALILARRGVISVAKRQKVTIFHIAIVSPNARFYPIAA